MHLGSTRYCCFGEEEFSRYIFHLNLCKLNKQQSRISFDAWGMIYKVCRFKYVQASPNPSRGMHVGEKAHHRSRSSHLKYQRWLVDLLWLTLEGGVNKGQFCYRWSESWCLNGSIVDSFTTIERRTGYRKIQHEKDIPKETSTVDPQGCYNLGYMVNSGAEYKRT
jgi:hypothetical protein